MLFTRAITITGGRPARRFFVCLCVLLSIGTIRAGNAAGWEAGVHLVRIDVDTIGEGPAGAGARVGYLLNRFVSVEAEANRYFEDPSGNFGHIQVLVGVRFGYWLGPFGIFAKSRPGLLRLGGGTAARNPGRENNFVLDVGGVVLIGRRRAGLRIDAGDTMIF